MRKQIANHKFKATVNYAKAIDQIGKFSTTLGKSADEVKSKAKFYTKQALRNDVESEVVIYQNLDEYPDFNWHEIERYEVYIEDEES